ncbi:hypothetical protein HK096_000413, partial [Nowakowskiella sp. JEL0078]
MRWPIQHLSTAGKLIVVGGQRDSLTFFTYNTIDRKFEMKNSDSKQRLTMTSLAVNERLAMGTDKSGEIFGLQQRESSILHALETVFTFKTGEIITQLKPGSLEFTAESLVNDEIPLKIVEATEELQLATLSENPNTSTKMTQLFFGSLWAFLLMSKSVFQPLELLQRIIQSHSKMKPLLGNDHFFFRSGDNPTHGVIDGDFVAQFLDLEFDDQKDIMT